MSATYAVLSGLIPIMSHQWLENWYSQLPYFSQHKLLATWSSGLKHRFDNDHDCEVDGSTPTSSLVVASLDNMLSGI